jgi:putative copper export protein
VELAALQVLLDLDDWQSLAIVTKAMTYGASFTAAGGVMFLGCFHDLLSGQEYLALKRFVVRAAWMAMLLSVLRIAVMNGMLSGELSGMLDVAMTQMVLQSSEGAATGLRLASLLVIVILCRKPLHGFSLWSALSAATIASTSFTLVGHASEVTMKAGFSLLSQSLLCIHLLGLAFWLGALWPLHRSTHDDDIARIAAIMERFGKLAARVVGLLIAAGLLLLWLLLLGKVDALWSSSYGQLFVVKLFCVALLLVLAAMNKLRLAPLLRIGGDTATVKLRRSIMAEMIVASLVLLVTACFTTVVGPAS